MPLSGGDLRQNLIGGRTVAVAMAYFLKDDSAVRTQNECRGVSGFVGASHRSP